MALGKRVRLNNGLRKLKMADIDPSKEGGYGDIYEVALLTAMSAETAEGDISLAAGNTIMFSAKNIGKTSGSVSFYGMSDEVEAKIFDVREGKNGGKVYGTKANRGAKALIIEATVVNPDTGEEEDAHIIFPKVSLGVISDEGTTKDADGNATINTKSLSFTALPLNNSFNTYKYINVGETPETLTMEMFEVKGA